MHTPDTAWIDTLNRSHGLPGQLWFAAGPGGLPWAHIHNASATAQVSLYGGQVMGFRPRAADADLLFVSERASYQPGKAIRGGVPVCWPWFGPDPQSLGRPNHGLARTRLWSVARSVALPDGGTQLTLELRDSDETLALWPHAYRLVLEITVGATLRLALTTRNTGEQAFTVTQALHSYFAVSDLAQTTVTGLDGCAYIDKAAGANGVVRVQQGAVGFAGEVDRIYTGAPNELALVDRVANHRLRIASEGSRTAVVWNPGAALAAGMADLGDGGYQRFVCVETANVEPGDAITLAPEAHHTLTMHLSTEPHP